MSRPDPQSLPSIDSVDSSVGKICFSFGPFNNRAIRTLFQQDVVSIPYVMPYWNGFIENICWKKVWMLPHTYLLVNKIKEVSFKIIHKYYPANHYMKKFKENINSNCSFCNDHPETVVHLFWHCVHVRKLWQDISRFIIEHIYEDFTLLWRDVLFGFFTYNRNKRNHFYVINFIILLAKFHIHKCKFTNRKPHFRTLQKEIELYFKTVKCSTNKKAV
ncbi:unnamed protein product [Oncorhynchus mykiss]|uniref:Reverse transcriptase zinc-binding domain-containing protein n=1 Tax=Oncorhynchus mykiss TaxID=8022 RepID=A0A061A7X9_ONCMY|nr:unnamed protein product [Oncorhynchus mykiss]